ncbi:MAG: hypothetical protein EAX96_17720 [Candidatus Lokiarchaeota archaeon]|nr:hypothetical protein [Candidatus Lokiarchaeota archaeon]
MRKITHNYGDIPDDIYTKAYSPLGKHLWRIFKEFGYQKILDMVEASPDYMYPELKERLDQTINTAKAIFDGKLPNPEKVVSYFLFPPVVSIRGDLNQGTMKLLFGESTDVTFIVINDYSREIFFLLNCHQEDGIPVDWWLVHPSDDFLDRRHMKLGIKLRKIPQKVAGLNKIGQALMSLLKDVRNERTPQWAQSAYQAGIVYGSAMANVLCERSSFEAFSFLWDGLNHKYYNLPDFWFCFTPWPPMIKNFLMLGRKQFGLKLNGLSLQHQLYVQGLEETAISWLTEHFSEVYNLVFKRQIDEGIPRPIDTLECQLPDLAKKSTYDNQDFEWKYKDPSKFIKLLDLGLTYEQIWKGVLLDVNHETTEEVTRSNLLSIGLGIHTEVIK